LKITGEAVPRRGYVSKPRLAASATTLGISGVVSAFDAVTGKLVWQKTGTL